MADQYAKCQSTYVSILENLTLPSGNPKDAVVDIHDLMDTEKCDSICRNLDFIRESTKKEINEGDPKRMDRILSRKCTEDDVDVCQATIRRYRTWYVKELKKSLRFTDRIEYLLKYESFYQSLAVTLSSAAILATAGFTGKRLYAYTAGIGIMYSNLKNWTNKTNKK